MNPQIRHAQRACEAAKARQAVVVWFDEHGQFAVASYGETVAECSAVKPVCNAIADMFDSGYLQPPGDERAEAGTKVVPSCTTCHKYKDNIPLARWPEEKLEEEYTALLKLLRLLARSGGAGSVLLGKLVWIAAESACKEESTEL